MEEETDLEAMWGGWAPIPRDTAGLKEDADVWEGSDCARRRGGAGGEGGAVLWWVRRLKACWCEGGVDVEAAGGKKT